MVIGEKFRRWLLQHDGDNVHKTPPVTRTYSFDPDTTPGERASSRGASAAPAAWSQRRRVESDEVVQL